MKFEARLVVRAEGGFVDMVDAGQVEGDPPEADGESERRDAEKLISLAAKSYFEDSGTPKGEDDYGYEGLRQLAIGKWQVNPQFAVPVSLFLLAGIAVVASERQKSSAGLTKPEAGSHPSCTENRKIRPSSAVAALSARRAGRGKRLTMGLPFAARPICGMSYTLSQYTWPVWVKNIT